MGDNILYFTVHLAVGKPLLFGSLHDRICDRMRKVFFKAGCHAKHLTRVFPIKRYHLRNSRTGFRERTGLVENDGIRLADFLHEASAFYSDMVAACLTHGRKNAQRHGKLQRAGKVHHEN